MVDKHFDELTKQNNSIKIIKIKIRVITNHSKTIIQSLKVNLRHMKVPIRQKQWKVIQNIYV
jgi:hypothetical protein